MFHIYVFTVGEAGSGKTIETNLLWIFFKITDIDELEMFVHTLTLNEKTCRKRSNCASAIFKANDDVLRARNYSFNPWCKYV